MSSQLAQELHAARDALANAEQKQRATEMALAKQQLQMQQAQQANVGGRGIDKNAEELQREVDSLRLELFSTREDMKRSEQRLKEAAQKKIMPLLVKSLKSTTASIKDSENKPTPGGETNSTSLWTNKDQKGEALAPRGNRRASIADCSASKPQGNLSGDDMMAEGLQNRRLVLKFLTNIMTPGLSPSSS